jgi:hypothetical protein
MKMGYDHSQYCYADGVSSTLTTNTSHCINA